MGLDGFAMSNLGINMDMTSAQMAAQTERLALKESEIKIKDVTESADGSGVKRKKDEESNDDSEFFDGFERKQNNSQGSNSGLTEKDFESRDPREFSVRMNPDTDMVELYNNREQRVLEVINPDDLMEIMSKLDYASGILVNRKI